MFVTLDKREGFADRVQYHDYAISPERFHWQTQNMAGANNSTGRRYLDSGENGWGFQLFLSGRMRNMLLLHSAPSSLKVMREIGRYRSCGGSSMRCRSKFSGALAC
ncbi:DUF3427 domain-containing protein [Undibacterium arcticum]